MSWCTEHDSPPDLCSEFGHGSLVSPRRARGDVYMGVLPFGYAAQPGVSKVEEFKPEAVDWYTVPGGGGVVHLVAIPQVPFRGQHLCLETDSERDLVIDRVLVGVDRRPLVGLGSLPVEPYRAILRKDEVRPVLPLKAARPGEYITVTFRTTGRDARMIKAWLEGLGVS